MKQTIFFIKNMYLIKGYTAQKLLKVKSWNERSLRMLFKNIHSWYTVDRYPESCRNVKCAYCG